MLHSSFRRAELGRRDLDKLRPTLLAETLPFRLDPEEAALTQICDQPCGLTTLGKQYVRQTSVTMILVASLAGRDRR